MNKISYNLSVCLSVDLFCSVIPFCVFSRKEQISKFNVYDLFFSSLLFSSSMYFLCFCSVFHPCPFFFVRSNLYSSILTHTDSSRPFFFSFSAFLVPSLFLFASSFLFFLSSSSVLFSFLLLFSFLSFFSLSSLSFLLFFSLFCSSFHFFLVVPLYRSSLPPLSLSFSRLSSRLLLPSSPSVRIQLTKTQETQETQ